MKNAKHTPGPWHTNSNVGSIYNTEGYLVAQTNGMSTENIPENIEVESNARLISLAPELLSALEFFVLEALEQDPQHRPALVAKQLINKAKGGAE